MPKKIPNTIIRNGVYQFKKRVPKALRASRAADLAEATSIIGALTPLLDQLEARQEEDTDA